MYSMSSNRLIFKCLHIVWCQILNQKNLFYLQLFYFSLQFIINRCILNLKYLLAQTKCDPNILLTRQSETARCHALRPSWYHNTGIASCTVPLVGHHTCVLILASRTNTLSLGISQPVKINNSEWIIVMIKVNVLQQYIHITYFLLLC